MAEATIADFREAVEEGDSDRVLATLADDITLNNPVTFYPFQGHDALAFVVPKLLEVWQDLRYIAELHGDELVGLVFDAQAGTRDVRGIDILHFDHDGLIDEITVMVRPLTGLQALASEMEAALSGGGG
jgi:hypothetical protein